VITGDGRQDGANSTRPEDKNGVNSMVIPEIAQAVVREKAQFLVFTGDLVLGAKDDDTFKKQLYYWRDLMKPVYDAHIPILACRGNHEVHSPNAVASWNEVFSGPYAFPQNGPDTEKNLSYTYSKDSVTMVCLDEYSAGKEQVNQAWLDTVLAAPHGPLLFAFGHEMAFFSGHHTDGLSVHPEARDAMIKSLINAHAIAFLCGHDHFYDHQEIRASNGDGVLQQYVAGTAGAPPVDWDHSLPAVPGWQITRLKHVPEVYDRDHPSYGYTVAEVDGHKITLTYMERIAPNKFVAREVNTYER
jgi:hypothetical protein